MLYNQLSIHLFEALPVSSNGLSYSNPAAISNLSDIQQRVIDTTLQINLFRHVRCNVL